MDTVESIEAAVGKVQKNLLNLQSEVPAFYIWGENPDTTESLLKVPMYFFYHTGTSQNLSLFTDICCPGLRLFMVGIYAKFYFGVLLR